MQLVISHGVLSLAVRCTAFQATNAMSCGRSAAAGILETQNKQACQMTDTQR